MKIQEKQCGGFFYGQNPNTDTSYTSSEAFEVFLNNLTSVKILTNSSISGITLLLTCDDTSFSNNFPYRHTRRGIFRKNMTTILMKICYCLPVNRENTNNIVVQIPSIKDSSLNDNRFEIMYKSDIEREVNIQYDIYKKSVSSKEHFMDSPVPSIVGYNSDVSAGFIIDFLNRIKRKNIFVERNIRDERLTDYQKLTNFVNVNLKQTDPEIKRIMNTVSRSDNDNHYGIILMEMMEGYDTYYNSRKQMRDLSIVKKYALHTLYELVFLAKMGYIHTDLHEGNILINPNAEYFTLNKSVFSGVITNKNLGRAIIIDFGRIKKITRSTIDLNNEPHQTILQYNNNNNDMLHSTIMRYLLPNGYNESGTFDPLHSELGTKFLELYNRRTNISEQYINLLTSYNLHFNIYLNNIYTHINGGGKRTKLSGKKHTKNQQNKLTDDKQEENEFDLDNYYSNDIYNLKKELETKSVPQLLYKIFTNHNVSDEEAKQSLRNIQNDSSNVSDFLITQLPKFQTTHHRKLSSTRKSNKTRIFNTKKKSNKMRISSTIRKSNRTNYFTHLNHMVY